jgi:hypothetical protein
MKYSREFKNADGTTSTWFYDTERFANGPYRVEIGYPKDTDYNKVFEEEYDEERDTSTDTSIPITKRRWTNPANGKLVGYTRAKNLGLVKS